MEYKKISMLLICFMFFLIYMNNQGFLFNILVNPKDSDYDIQKKYNAYLVEQSEEYVGVPQKISNRTDTCILFVNSFSHEGVYTPECSQKAVDFKSETGKFSLEDEVNDDTVYYDSIYEKLYAVDKITSINNFSKEDLLGYNFIYAPKDEMITNFFPKNFEYVKVEDVYTVTNEEYIEKITKIQNKVIKVLSGFIIIYIFYEYIRSKKKEFAVYQLLGISNFKIMKRIFFDYFIAITFSFLIAMSLYYGIVYLNGKLFYIDLYFEYFSFKGTIIIYIKSLVCVIPLMLSLLYINNFISLEKRIK